MATLLRLIHQWGLLQPTFHGPPSLWKPIIKQLNDSKDAIKYNSFTCSIILGADVNERLSHPWLQFWNSAYRRKLPSAAISSLNGLSNYHPCLSPSPVFHPKLNWGQLWGVFQGCCWRSGWEGVWFPVTQVSLTEEQPHPFPSVEMKK